MFHIFFIINNSIWTVLRYTIEDDGSGPVKKHEMDKLPKLNIFLMGQLNTGQAEPSPFFSVAVSDTTEPDFGSF